MILKSRASSLRLTQPEEDNETWIDDCVDDSEDDRKPAASATLVVEQQGSGGPAPVVAVAMQGEDMVPDSMVTTAVAFIRPHTFHPLQLNDLEGTSLENTALANFRGIRYWLNVTKLYGPMFAVMARWLYGLEGRQQGWHPVANSTSSWFNWLKRNNADGDNDELRHVAAELKNALGVDRIERHRLTGRPPSVKARLLSRAEYSAAEGDDSTPLCGDDRTFGKVAASGRSVALLNLDWMVRCNAGDGQQHPPPVGFVEVLATSDQALATRVAAHAESEAREQRRKLKKRSNEGIHKQVII
jgi:hypothetical protein